jgi:single-stranded DNA-specific DHH superfamily exonuclease
MSTLAAALSAASCRLIFKHSPPILTGGYPLAFAEFEKKATAAISELKITKTKMVTVIHHDDADGLSSGAITKTALEREGFKIKTFCLEKIYPEVVEDMHKTKGQIIFYSDIGSAHADYISQVNSGKNLTIILDHHHDPPQATDRMVHDLNLEHFGFEGDTEFSGATCNYLFAKTMNKNNIDLSYLALTGSREIPVGYVGLNKIVLREAEKNGVIKTEREKITIIKLGLRVDDLFAKLQILGAVGYYDGGPEMGVHACLNGFTDEIRKKIREWEERRKSVNKRITGWLYRERLKETENLQWFDAGDLYKGMGTKVIGQFCSFLSYQTRLIKQDKYLLGLMNVQPEVPGWNGKLKGPLVKISVRVPKILHELIDKGKMVNAVDLVRKASEGFGAADGHKYAANVVIPAGKKEVFLRSADAHTII